MDRYKSHIALTDEYGSRCEYCLQAWPCDAVEQATLARAAARSELKAVQAFVERVNARAEARMQEGHPLEGQHWLAIQAELKLLVTRAGADAGD